MPIVRPRLTDYYEIPVSQADTDFTIPFLDEDIPLHVDPFLLWRSPSLQDNALHTQAVQAFNQLGRLQERDSRAAEDLLINISECDEVGLGSSHTRRGKRIGRTKAKEILLLFKAVPEYAAKGFAHFEEIQFYVDAIGSDRISDICCNFIKSFLIDYTIDQCNRLGIPTSAVDISVYDYKTSSLAMEHVTLPADPESNHPIILVPKRWLRYKPFLNFDDYYRDFHEPEHRSPQRAEILNFNRQNYGLIRSYVQKKELERDSCTSDPLFTQIPITSARASLRVIKQLPTGTQDANDKTYEKEAGRLLASLLYPQLDFAAAQSRTENGVLIRDLVFYNTKNHLLLQDLWNTYGSRQIVFELKNVRQIEGEHINQLNRYLSENFGKFGVLLTRNSLRIPMMRNTTQLWSGQRKCIIAVTDEDLELMVELFDGHQRDPIDVINKKYVEFLRACPS
jgi:hypothetical protein